jgi:ribosomal protein L9
MAVKAKTAPASRSTRSRAQVQQEFGAIRQQSEAAREAASPKAVEIEQRHAQEVREAVEAVSVESVAKRIKELDGEVSRTLGELAGKLTGEVDLLTQLREAVQLERQELERLRARRWGTPEPSYVAELTPDARPLGACPLKARAMGLEAKGRKVSGHSSFRVRDFAGYAVARPARDGVRP